VNKYSVAGMVLVASMVTAQGAAAQDSAAKSGTPASPWYMGIGIGQTNASIPDQTIDAINSSLTTANAAAFSVIDEDKNSTGMKFLVGYTLSRNFALEGGYAQPGKSKVSMDFRSGLNSVGTFNMDYKMTAAFIDIVGMIPFAEKWALIGRVGVAYGKTSANMDGSPVSFAISNDDKSDTEVREKFGAGIDYNINPKFTIRAEWERYKMPDPFSDELINADTATLGLLFRF
jgi:OOP family OmpA-OmpF porin